MKNANASRLCTVSVFIKTAARHAIDKVFDFDQISAGLTALGDLRVVSPAAAIAITHATN